MFKLIRNLFILIIVILAVGWVYYTYQITSLNNGSQETVSFEIASGTGVNQISYKLYQAGLVKSRFYFEVYVWLKGLEDNFIAGVHDLNASMSIKELTDQLTKSGSNEETITIIEGWNNQQIADYLQEQNLVKSEDFLNLVSRNVSRFKDEYDFLSDKPDNLDLEGYLFPDTYRIFKSSPAEHILRKMLSNLGQKLSGELKEEIERQGKTVFEVLTLASIIEKEVRTAEDMKMVADIFYKRLEAGIALQSDATVNYITGKGRTQPSLEDTRVDNPYNTYRYRGLPPGPISNPGLKAIEAAVYPTANPYYYFLTTDSGQVIYSKTYDEHLENKYRHLN
ncbi:MAG: endolytic transglycosylase MltG [Candidatus Komeilibacteria bacterium CG10_big_fil_rev_8_21_14_0_10_41_13]|uniref:Endolytic murein transglycosylase n=1 Tax=Candidatus Komeilibacteria bacterium CG10_big_fil_rev_8_21_14_0_10_41_13 TaxID=1974476 RepID=A0A2M6WCG6_9BACT|nr:MAG: endolytic transglycosylase MltG [Candidatus Komeilibacteria bacterium CG10_big_fil_rev_8_21_14_0_10_41_13]